MLSLRSLCPWSRHTLSTLALIWLLLGILGTGVAAQPAGPESPEVLLDSGQDRFFLNPYMSYLLTDDPDLTPDQVLARRDWLPNPGERILNLGFSSQILWARTRLQLSEDSAGQWFLVIPYHLLDRVDLFVLDAETGRVLQRFDQPTPAGGLADYFNLSYALEPPLSGRLEILVRVQTSFSLQLHLEAWTREHLVGSQIWETFSWGCFFGIMIALVAYNLFLFFSVWERAYFYYVLYLGSWAALMLTISGLGGLYDWPRDRTFLHYAVPAFVGLSSAGALLFTRAFLQWRGIPARLDRLLAALAFCAVPVVALSWYRVQWGPQLCAWFFGVVLAVALTAGIMAWRAGIVIARYFVLAWLMLALGVALFMLNMFGVLPLTRITGHAIQLGSALEAILLSFALAHRIKEERRQKLRAIRRQLQAEQQMQELHLQALEQAMHDPVTRMPNDALLVAALQEMIEESREAGEKAEFALHLMSFPLMKEVTSALGRGMSESLFRTLVRDLNRALMTRGWAVCIEERIQAFLAVAEFGSVAFIRKQAPGSEPSWDDVLELMGLFDEVVDLGNIAVNLDVYCGIALFPDHGDRADILVQHAAAARDQGVRTHQRICLFEPAMDLYGRRRLALMGELSRAIRNGELELYLQPQVDSRRLVLSGAEILARWHSARHGPIATAEFIEIAEDAGLMRPLTRYVMRRAMTLHKELQRLGLDITVSVNLSVQNLIEPNFVPQAISMVRECRVDTAHILLEVTETALIDKIGTVGDNLQKLAQAGFRIALDDFGTGYSYLTYLSRLTIHELKIDRSFVSRMRQNSSDYRIVENTIKLARMLGIETVAEGVEDAATLEELKQLGCNRVQGYYIGKPMPIAQFHRWALNRAG